MTMSCKGCMSIRRWWLRLIGVEAAMVDQAKNLRAYQGGFNQQILETCQELATRVSELEDQLTEQEVLKKLAGKGK